MLPEAASPGILLLMNLIIQPVGLSVQDGGKIRIRAAGSYLWTRRATAVCDQPGFCSEGLALLHVPRRSLDRPLDMLCVFSPLWTVRCLETSGKAPAARSDSAVQDNSRVKPGT